MQKIFSHSEVPFDELNQPRRLLLDSGKETTYTVNYDNRLIVNMPFMGQDKNSQSNVNSCGWKRDNMHYFQELLKQQPEAFSEENNWQIKDGLAPYCDQCFVQAFPEFKDFVGQKLVHHHIGEDGQAVALPQGLHTGYGYVHNDERELGVTGNGRLFSNSVERAQKLGTPFEWKHADRHSEAVMQSKRKQERQESLEKDAKASRSEGPKECDGSSNKQRATPSKDQGWSLWRGVKKTASAAGRMIAENPKATLTVAVAIALGVGTKLVRAARGEHVSDDAGGLGSEEATTICDMANFVMNSAEGSEVDTSGMAKVSVFANIYSLYKSGQINRSELLEGAAELEKTSGKSFFHYLGQAINFQKDEVARDLRDGLG